MSSHAEPGYFSQAHTAVIQNPQDGGIPPLHEGGALYAFEDTPQVIVGDDGYRHLGDGGRSHVPHGGFSDLSFLDAPLKELLEVPVVDASGLGLPPRELAGDERLHVLAPDAIDQRGEPRRQQELSKHLHGAYVALDGLGGAITGAQRQVEAACQNEDVIQGGSR